MPLIMMSLVTLILLAFATCASPLIINVTIEDEERAKSFLLDLQEAANAFRDEIRKKFPTRCDFETFNSCSFNNYNDCSSAFPNPTCFKRTDLGISKSDFVERTGCEYGGEL
jgi:hypothetical protein